MKRSRRCDVCRGDLTTAVGHNVITATPSHPERTLCDNCHTFARWRWDRSSLALSDIVESMRIESGHEPRP